MKTIRPGGALDPVRQRVFDAVAWTTTAMFIALLGVHEAHAGEHRYANGDPAYQAECGSCHIAYPPGLMSASGWTAVFGRLDRHYGVDASLDAATTRRLLDYSVAHASGKARAEPANLRDLPRITTLPWFVKEHRERDGRAAARGIKSMSDCAACHVQAAQGDFSESTLRLPRTR
jgi:cytochrome c2